MQATAYNALRKWAPEAAQQDEYSDVVICVFEVANPRHVWPYAFGHSTVQHVGLCVQTTSTMRTPIYDAVKREETEIQAGLARLHECYHGSEALPKVLETHNVLVARTITDGPSSVSRHWGMRVQDDSNHNTQSQDAHDKNHTFYSEPMLAYTIIIKPLGIDIMHVHTEQHAKRQIEEVLCLC